MLVSIFNPPADASPETLGGKGFGLVGMYKSGLNVPPALIIPTSVCRDYMTSPKMTMKKVAKKIKDIQMFFVKEFDYLPLLSVRSGARVSMAGMMDTILNVGLSLKTMDSWEVRLGTACVADSFKRLITMYGTVVNGFEREKLELPSLPEALASYNRMAKTENFPDVEAQLLGAIEAVFKSWNNARAKSYRKINNIPDDWGTAVVIQAMVFGNLNENSCTGVLFTRNPFTGANEVTGEFLVNAQGEDVVAGVRTPMSLANMYKWSPKISSELMETVTALEKDKRNVQDVEFTVQDGKLYFLQTRTATRSAAAAIKIAMDMSEDGLISKAEMHARVSQRDLDLAEQPVIDPKFKVGADFVGLAACPGAKIGTVARSSKSAVEMAKAGKNVILVTKETTPNDIDGMYAAIGIVTLVGGSTCHAAVVARSMNRSCVVGVGITADYQFKEGETISMDGGTGRVWLSEIPVVPGASDLVKKFRSDMVGDQWVKVTQVPDFVIKNVVLDLGDHLHWDIADIGRLISSVAAKAKTLEVVMSLPSKVSDVFLPTALLSVRAAKIATLVKKLGFKEHTGNYALTYSEIVGRINAV